MIDTVVLTLSKDMFAISEPDKFVPSARWALHENARFPFGMQSKQNPTKKELLQGIYKPRLTLSHRINSTGKNEISLKVEISLPKLFFGNNFDELQYKDLASLVQKLAAVLQHMGVVITADMLAQAPVSAVHYSKNIPLTDGSIPYHFINKIKEANIKLSLDVNQTDYRNDGHSYKWHCNSYEVVFYDKIKDLEKAQQSSKRALEKDSAVQLSLLNTFKNRKKFEVLRMEVRLNKRQKIKPLLKTLGIKSDLSLKSLFKPAISRKVLLHYIDELESKRSSLLDYKATNDKALLTTLILNNPELSTTKILQMFGLKKALEEVTMRELRVMFSKHNQRSWYRLMADANNTKLPITKNVFGIIREHIVKFKTLRRFNIRQEGLNMHHRFYSVNQTTHRFIYLDNNVFRLLLNNSTLWNNFFELFHNELPGLFEDIQFIFTWSQLLEALDLGTIINDIRNSSSWKTNLDGKNICRNRAPADWLDDYFDRVRNIITQMPVLQQHVLLERIDKALSHINHPSAKILANETLLKMKGFIEANDYMEDLSFELAWALITSYDFIVSDKQWLSRNDYFGCLIALWHKRSNEKHELIFYRLLDRRYHAYINYSPNLDVGDAELTKDKFKPLKPGSDLCDGELIHFASLGFLDPKTGQRYPVIGITFDTSETISQRLSVMKQGLIELQRDVQGWNLNTTPGEIFSFKYCPINHTISKGTRIPFNTPFNRPAQ